MTMKILFIHYIIEEVEKEKGEKEKGEPAENKIEEEKKENEEVKKEKKELDYIEKRKAIDILAKYLTFKNSEYNLKKLDIEENKKKLIIIWLGYIVYTLLLKIFRLTIERALYYLLSIKGIRILDIKTYILFMLNSMKCEDIFILYY